MSCPLRAHFKIPLRWISAELRRRFWNIPRLGCSEESVEDPLLGIFLFGFLPSLLLFKEQFGFYQTILKPKRPHGGLAKPRLDASQPVSRVLLGTAAAGFTEQ